VANELLRKVLVHSQICVYRFHIRLLIILANDVEMNPGSCYRVDLSETVTADYHQGDVSLFRMSVGLVNNVQRCILLHAQFIRSDFNFSF